MLTNQQMFMIEVPEYTKKRLDYVNQFPKFGKLMEDKEIRNLVAFCLSRGYRDGLKAKGLLSEEL